MKSKEVIEYDEFTKKLLKGLDLSYQRLIEDKAAQQPANLSL